MQLLGENVPYLTPGMVLFHQPRGHYYIVKYKTMIKKDDGSWEYGWAYVQAEEDKPSGKFVCKTSAEVFTRALSQFDSDWYLAY